MRKRRAYVWLAILLLLACVLLAAYSDTAYVVYGWCRGESFYGGMPTSYWSTSLKEEYQRLSGRRRQPSDFERIRSWVFAKLGIRQTPDNPYAKISWQIDGAVPVLVELLREPDWEVRLVAAELLSRQQQKDLGALAALAVVLQDANPEVRQTAVVTIGSYRSQAITVVPQVRELLADDDPMVRVFAAQALWRINSDEAAIDTVTTVLKSPSAKARRHALGVLSEIGPAAGKKVVEISPLLEDADVSVRTVAKETIRAIASSSEGMPKQ